MEPVAATAGLYAAETAVEGGVAAYWVSKSSLPLSGRLMHIALKEPITRSSHTLSVIQNRAYIFGGELQPREPVPNNVEAFDLPSGGTTAASQESIPPKPSKDGEDVPTARVGHSAATARGLVFIFGGRGGAEMTALEEKGRLWVFDAVDKTWTFLDPPPGTDYPESRSYHCSASDGNAIIVHAGCASGGGRLSDTWVFYLDQGRWSRLADAPAPSRGGTSICITQDRLYRFGGFDGKNEIGGQLDYMDLPTTPGAPNATSTTPEALQKSSPPTEWHSTSFSLPADQEKPTSPPSTIPAARSLAALHAIATGQGRHYLLLALGEGDPSTIGHAGAGKFHQDIWAYALPAPAMSAAGIKDAIRARVPGLGSEVGQWAKVEIKELEVGAEETEGGTWTGRGWFGSAVVDKGFAIWGGLDEKNERLGDGWLLSLS
ncbi:MAG: hypothetical protein Q9160_004603 [Pyrenula sp. 1 TL-2023]